MKHKRVYRQPNQRQHLDICLCSPLKCDNILRQHTQDKTYLTAAGDRNYRNDLIVP